MDDYLPISYINQFLYCPRRYWYMHVLGEMEVNAPVLEGTLQHERAHQPGRQETAEGEPAAYRRVYVWSDRLQIAGFCDLIEIEAGEMTPVEHKHGRQGRWDNDAAQLCAQALCLEEMTGRSVTRGEVFYWGSRRRVPVSFDAALRGLTEAAITQIRTLVAAGRLPPPLTSPRPGLPAKCRQCSLEPICLPAEVNLIS
jgi:CRISPR-associated exonuclease Cas4